MKPTLIIHGGAGSAIANAGRKRAIQRKMERILAASYAELSSSTAVEAVRFAVRLLENDPEFNAGTGSLLQADGHARLSASIMDGKRQRFAGVINVEKIKNPVDLAFALLECKDRVLSGAHAFRYARNIGMTPYETRTKQAVQRWKNTRKEGFDTVGACALDRFGNLASATSTGGRGWEMPGRVSDSGTPAANFADAHAAVSATGTGEEILDEGLAVRIAVRVIDGMSLNDAFKKTFGEVRSRNHKMGAIGIDNKGRIAFAASTESLVYAWTNGKRKGLFD